MIISERVYWLSLIIGFITFAILLWVWLIPYEIIEYNLAVNLFTSSIFMVATVVFLSWLILIRERTEWHKVRDEVFFRIRLELLVLFTLSLEYFEGGPELKLALLAEKDEDKKIDKISSFLRSKHILKKGHAITDKFLNDDTELSSFLEVEGKIANVQSTYSKHLPANITVLLMKVQQHIWGLDTARQFFINANKIPTIENTIIHSYKDSKQLLFEIHLKGIMKEINELYTIEELQFKIPY